MCRVSQPLGHDPPVKRIGTNRMVSYTRHNSESILGRNDSPCIHKWHHITLISFIRENVTPAKFFGFGLAGGPWHSIVHVHLLWWLSGETRQSDMIWYVYLSLSLYFLHIYDIWAMWMGYYTCAFTLVAKWGTHQSDIYALYVNSDTILLLHFYTSQTIFKTCIFFTTVPCWTDIYAIDVTPENDIWDICGDIYGQYMPLTFDMYIYLSYTNMYIYGIHYAYHHNNPVSIIRCTPVSLYWIVAIVVLSYWLSAYWNIIYVMATMILARHR